MNPEKVGIAGTGFYVPERVLTNFDLEKMVDTSDEWIVNRTGIRERRIAGPEETVSSMSEEASRVALKAAGVKPEEVWAEGKYRRIVEARSLLCYWAVRELGVPMSSLARKLGISIASVSESVTRGRRIAEAKRFLKHRFKTNLRG